MMLELRDYQVYEKLMVAFGIACLIDFFRFHIDGARFVKPILSSLFSFCKLWELYKDDVYCLMLT